MLKEILGVIVVMNIIGFITMWKDKQAAKKNKWRTQEKTIFLVSALGGSIGVWIGMQTFRHKTKHAQFVYGVPFIFGVQLVIAYYLFK